MDFGSLLSVAQKNAKTGNHSSERSKFYSTKFEPPKKETKEKKLSDGIKKFLAQKDNEEAKEKERKRKEYAELMALRTEREKNKIRKHLKVTKSANKSVLDDAVNSTDTAVTLQGPEQPDEDDYGYTSNAASALYKSLMDKYKSMPEDKKFSKSSLNSGKTGDLMSTKDRVRAAIMREKEDEKLGRKRTTTTTTSADISSSSSSSDQKHHSRKNLYDPRAEREAEERKKRELENEKRQKMKNKRPPPPVMDFQKLLKLAEEKQHEPIKVEVPQKPKEPERLLTSKEKREIEMKKKELEERERRRSGLPPSKPPSKPQSNGEQRKPEATNGRIPKLNGSNTAPAKSSTSHPTLDSRKPSPSSMREPIKPVSSASLHNKPPSKPQSQPSTSGSRPTFAKPSTPQPNGKRPLDSKSKNQMHDTARSIPKQNNTSKPAPKALDSRNVKPRDFPPKDLVKTREFPPRDVVKSREFPPRDLVKTREFPPRDMQRSHMSMKQKQLAASKRRLPDDYDDYDDEEDEDEYDSMDDFIDDDEGFDYSSEIKNIFGYDKSRYRDEDDDIDNMESSFAQQQREEFVSKKIGIMEDLEDMRQEAEEKKRKAAKRRRL